MWWMVRNSQGRKDALLTFALWGTLVVLVKVIVSGMVIGKITFGVIDATLATAVLVSTIGAYTTKRIKGAKDQGEAISSAVAKVAAASRPVQPVELERTARPVMSAKPGDLT